MFHVFDEYRKMMRIPARAFNALAKFCNNLSGGWGINIERPDSPSHSAPVRIEVNPNDLTEAGFTRVPVQGGDETNADFAARATPCDCEGPDVNETDAEKVARVGTSNEAARADHVHRMPFGINPLADGDDAANNVPSEDIYVPDEDEDTSDLDLSGTSDKAARADHTHKLPFTGYNTDSGGLKLYANIHKITGSSHYAGTPCTFTIENGIITDIQIDNEIDLFNENI